MLGAVVNATGTNLDAQVGQASVNLSGHDVPP